MMMIFFSGWMGKVCVLIISQCNVSSDILVRPLMTAQGSSSGRTRTTNFPAGFCVRMQFIGTLGLVMVSVFGLLAQEERCKRS